MNYVALWIALAVLFLSFFGLMLLSKRQKTFYRVLMANPEMSEQKVYRTGWDRLWRSDEAGMMLFHTLDGKEVRIGKHWIQKIEELEDAIEGKT